MDDAGLDEWGRKNNAQLEELKDILCPVIEKHRKNLQRIIQQSKVLRPKDDVSRIELYLAKSSRQNDIFNLSVQIFEEYTRLEKGAHPALIPLAKQWLEAIEEMRGALRLYQEKHDIPMNFTRADLEREGAEADAKYDIGFNGKILGVDHNTAKHLVVRHDEALTQFRTR